jgi:hypothetical protein
MTNESAAERAELAYESVFEALLPNANFWVPSADAGASLAPERTVTNRDEADSNRYFAGTEALEVLAWLATSVAVPFVVGVASSRVVSRLDRRTAASGNREAARQEVIADVAEALVRRDPRGASRDELDLAEEHVRLLLVDHGWPAQEARDDALEIVSRIASELDPG